MNKMTITITMLSFIIQTSLNLRKLVLDINMWRGNGHAEDASRWDRNECLKGSWNEAFVQSLEAISPSSEAKTSRMN